ncbi:hypothetical protein DFQ03_2569 [Maribacter caenipelagi]|uniref:Uncharacterized protein n=1 Tax=Maribacter caenipelagi TaxID=1447781 RepID=A0A4R7D2G9_9FLAO|nr:hypothetical protein [Maribacter caenipelagi]TDS14482.1 hypothetical protein DFQ03_2569 [Maribacter caenipelagi]
MEYDSPKFKKWLDKLQQESWQLELIISGFAIYALFASYEFIELKSATSAVTGILELGALWAIALICCQIFIFNLLFHVLLRGLWIGAIGLRYVSGDIDYSNLNYSEKFSSYLKKKVGSFDQYIANLETYCSIIFAISFLMIFYVIGFFGVMFSLVVLDESLRLLTFIPKEIMEIIAVILTCIFLISALIIFIDFLSQGFLKRKKWTSKIYFPIYWIFSKLTLSFLYRPLTYNFLDNKLGKRISYILLPIYILIVFIASIEYKSSNYLSLKNDSSEFQIFRAHYDNLSTEKDMFIDIASIPSKIINTKYLPLFLLYNRDIEDFLFDKNKSLKPKIDKRGFQSSITINFNAGEINSYSIKDSINLKDYLETINSTYIIEIDSNKYPSDFIISSNAKERLGFETYLNIKNLNEGKHMLVIKGPGKKDEYDRESKTIEKILVTIPFWYFPENREPSNAQNINISKDTLTTN